MIFYVFVGRITTINSSTIKSFRQRLMSRFSTITCDLGYLLRHPPSSEALNEPTRKSFLDGMKAYLTILRLFEDADSVKRMLGLHIPIELDWKEIFYFQRYLQPITSGFIDWLSQNKDLLLQAVNEVFEALKQLHPPAKMRRVEDKIFSGYSCKVF